MDDSAKILFVIPAAPDFYVLDPDRTASDHDVWKDGRNWTNGRTPVVGWAVTASGYTVPVTQDQVLTADINRAILCPDARVRSSIEEWADLDEWRARQVKARVQA